MAEQPRILDADAPENLSSSTVITTTTDIVTTTSTEMVTVATTSNADATVNVGEPPVETSKVETAAERMEREINAFQAIREFSNDLDEMFGRKKKRSSLAMYNRLIQKIELDDEASIAKTLSGFHGFFMLNSKYVIETDAISKLPRGTIIKYGISDTICIDIQHFIYEADDETKEVIRQHLLVIYGLLNPESRKVASDELEKSINSLNIDESTNEGKFLGNFFKGANETLANTPQPDNPMAAITGLLTSPIFTNLLAGLEQGVKSKTIDPAKMMGGLQSALGGMVAEMGKNPKGGGKR